MKIAVYDKWASSIGGGEKVATVMCEVLAGKGHQVDFLTTFAIDKKELESKMAVDLSNVKLIALRERSYEKIKNITKRYDIFINTSFLDVQPSLAKRSIYYVHFPSQVKKTLLGFIKYETILPFLRRFLIIPEINKGLEIMDDVNSRAGVWLRKENDILIANPPKYFTLRIRIYSDILSVNTINKIKLESGNAKVKLVDKKVDHQTSTMVLDYKITPDDTISVALIIKILDDFKKSSMALVSVTIKDVRFLVWNFLKRYLPRYEMALYGSGSYKPEGGIDTYDLFLSNSNFTKYWTKKYWDKTSTVLYPPVDVELFNTVRIKNNIILSVGRFFVGGHSKRQDVLIKAFKRLYDGNTTKNWELHLVGGIEAGWEHSEYVRSLQTESKGYPIYFHFSASFKDLKDLYAKAKYYWHATGYEKNLLRSPVSFEHFGITVVEAMSAGCVPIVFDGGGLKETVKRKDNLTFKTISGLVDITNQLIKDPERTKLLSRDYQKEARKYSRINFTTNLLKLIK
jgi:glycosyltransferase involved in cell wall biosynthesis